MGGIISWLWYYSPQKSIENKKDKREPVPAFCETCKKPIQNGEKYAIRFHFEGVNRYWCTLACYNDR